MRGHSLVELTEHDVSAANVIVHGMCTYIYCCIHSTLCVPIMNGRRRGTPKESRKQALSSAWSMKMSRPTRDGLPNPSCKDGILSASYNHPCTAKSYSGAS